MSKRLQQPPRIELRNLQQISNIRRACKIINLETVMMLLESLISRRKLLFIVAHIIQEIRQAFLVYACRMQRLTADGFHIKV
ncbi:hypothetical protein D3C78_1132400 [compost metagenome]